MNYWNWPNSKGLTWAEWITLVCPREPSWSSRWEGHRTAWMRGEDPQEYAASLLALSLRKK